jgi:hypothetical protein
MTPRALNAHEADRAVRDFRRAHVIIPVHAPVEDILGGFICDFDGIRVYEVRGGWRHNLDDVRLLIEKAPPVFPEERA